MPMQGGPGTPQYDDFCGVMIGGVSVTQSYTFWYEWLGNGSVYECWYSLLFFVNFDNDANIKFWFK